MREASLPFFAVLDWRMIYHEKVGGGVGSHYVSVGYRAPSSISKTLRAEVDYLCKSMSTSDSEAARKGVWIIWIKHGLFVSFCWFHNLIYNLIFGM